MFDIYYLIYGFKLIDIFTKKLIDFVVESGECDLEMVEEICREDGWEWDQIKDTEKRYEYVDMEYLENFIFEQLNCLDNGDCFVGKVLWSTENINWDSSDPADMNNFPSQEISIKKRVGIQVLVDSFKERLPDDLVKIVPSIDFYWCIESS